jgi:hypothetical protein
MTTSRIAHVVLVSIGLAVASARGYASPRHLTFNGHPASARDLATVALLEQGWHQQLPDGDYWYDTVSGAAGRWGGPVAAILPAGLGIGGRLPANASGGTTGTFINGRELHWLDVQQLIAIFGRVQRGRFWVDANGNAGYEGGPAFVNLYSAARQARGGGGWNRRVMGGASGGGVDMASDGTTTCFNTAGRTDCIGN